MTATRSELGLRTDKSFAMEDGVFTLRGRAAWAHDYNSDRNVGATFQTLPGASFVVNGARLASDSALLTASAEKKWLNGWSAAGTFEGEFSNVTTSYAGKGCGAVRLVKQRLPKLAQRRCVKLTWDPSSAPHPPPDRRDGSSRRGR